MVTNSIQELKDGEGNYNFLLSVQGRIQGDATIFAEPDALLMETASSQVPTLMTLLDRFVIMDDVELADVSSTRSGLTSRARRPSPCWQRSVSTSPAWERLRCGPCPWNPVQIRASHMHSPLVPRFELWADHETTSKLLNALQIAGASTLRSQGPGMAANP